ncbi:hypothetical protein [Azospirillum griseum]|nr:hypothetical protein [Azospirillum griseum]
MISATGWVSRTGPYSGRLAEEGLSFSDLVERVRRDLEAVAA